MRARGAMAARVGASRGDGAGSVDEWAIWRLRLGDHRDWSSIAALHRRAEIMLESRFSRFSRQKLEDESW